jgi:probable rRNA maturation factor
VREPLVVADIVLCAEVVEREALEQQVSLADHYAHLLIHGALHALGHDHQKAREARIMEALETQLLAQIGVADPYHRSG